MCHSDLRKRLILDARDLRRAEVVRVEVERMLSEQFVKSEAKLYKRLFPFL